MSELIKLAEWCEKANGSDRKIDDRIKLAVAAAMFARGQSKDAAIAALGGDLHADPLPYTSSMDAAMKLIPPTHTFGMGDLNEDGNAWACLTDRAGVDYASTNVTQPILALCAAALRATAA